MKPRCGKKRESAAAKLPILFYLERKVAAVKIGQEKRLKSVRKLGETARNMWARGEKSNLVFLVDVSPACIFISLS